MNDFIWYTYQWTISAALSLLPAQMTSREARTMMLATALQESEINARIQGGKGYASLGKGPAHGLWQFERLGGVREILTSANTKDYAVPICKMFLVNPTPDAVWAAIVYNDVLAAVFARLLLWRDPRPMPSPIEVQKGWDIYLKNWRPGKPHPETWPGNFETGWKIVKGE